MILKRQCDKAGNISLVNFAIDEGRISLVEDIISEELTKPTEDVNFILHILKNHPDTSYFDDLWPLVTEKHFFGQDENGDSALHIMSTIFSQGIAGKISKVLQKFSPHQEELLRITNNNGNTPLKIAIDEENIEAAKVLLTKESLIFNRASEENALFESIKKRNLALTDYILKNFSDFIFEFNFVRKRVVHNAFKHKFFDGVKIIIKYAAESHIFNLMKELINSSDENGMTPLFLSMYYKKSNLVDIILEVDQIQFDSTDKDRKTALHLAVEYNQPDNVKKLLQKTYVSLINSQDSKGNTPLMTAIQNGKIYIISKLMEVENLDINLENDLGENLLHLIAKFGTNSDCQKILNICPSDDCLSTRKDKSGLLPLQMVRENFDEKVKSLLIHNPEHCGNRQINHIMETLKSPSEEDIFISTVLFETIMTIWSGCENSLAWYATDHERCMVLKKIISSMNIQDVETCVKYGTQEHKSESLRVFQVSVNLAKILSYEEVEEFLKTSKMEEFDIIQHILSPYQCQNSKDKQEIFKNSTRAIFIDYLNDKQELINSHLEFFTNFDDQDLLQFVVEKVSSDVLQELGAKILDLAITKRLLNSLTVLLKISLIPMDDKYFNMMLKRPFSTEVDFLIMMKRSNLNDVRTIDDSDGNTIIHKCLELEKVDVLHYLLEGDHNLVSTKNVKKENAAVFALKYHSKLFKEVSSFASGDDLGEPDIDGQSTLHVFASKPEIFELFPIDKSISGLNRKDSKNQTSLALCMKARNTEMAMKLIEFGASLRNLDDVDSNILHLCSKFENEQVAFVAVEKSKDLLNEKDKNGDHPHHLTVTKDYNSQTMLAFYLKQGNFNISSTNQDGINALQLALTNNENLVQSFDLKEMKNYFKDEDDLKNLINATDKQQKNMSVIGFAIANCKRDSTIHHLLESWKDLIDVSITDSDGHTPLHIGMLIKKETKIIQMLLDCNECPGPDKCFTKFTADSETPLGIALKNLNIKNQKDSGFYILGHNAECGRDQVYNKLTQPQVMENLIDGVNDELFFFLLEWQKSSRANLLYVATQLEKKKLLEAIFEKENVAQKCIETGLNEAIKFAAEELLLEPLNFLLYKDRSGTSGDVFKNCISQNPDLQGDLMHKAAENDCEKIFKWILGSVSSKWLREMIENDPNTTIVHSIAKGKTCSLELFKLVIKKLSKLDDQVVIKDLLGKTDINGNTALHIAAKEPSNDKLEIITSLLERGANPAHKNNNDDTFLMMSVGMEQNLCAHVKNMPDKWFENLMKNQELLGNFIELENDSIFCAILKKFMLLSKFDHQDPARVHPITLIDKIWNKRGLLKESMHQLEIWEAKFHKNKLKDLKRCCHKELKPDRSFQIYSSITDIVDKPLGIAFYARNAFSSTFILLLYLKILDFATDVTLNVEYYQNPQNLFQDFPSNESCIANFTIACHFSGENPMDTLVLFYVSLAIFLVTYLMDFIFVMTYR